MFVYSKFGLAESVQVSCFLLNATRSRLGPRPQLHDQTSSVCVQGAVLGDAGSLHRGSSGVAGQGKQNENAGQLSAENLVLMIPMGIIPKPTAPVFTESLMCSQQCDVLDGLGALTCS